MRWAMNESCISSRCNFPFFFNIIEMQPCGGGHDEQPMTRHHRIPHRGNRRGLQCSDTVESFSKGEYGVEDSPCHVSHRCSPGHAHPANPRQANGADSDAVLVQGDGAQDETRVARAMAYMRRCIKMRAMARWTKAPASEGGYGKLDESDGAGKAEEPRPEAATAGWKGFLEVRSVASACARRPYMRTRQYVAQAHAPVPRHFACRYRGSSSRSNYSRMLPSSRCMCLCSCSAMAAHQRRSRHSTSSSSSGPLRCLSRRSISGSSMRGGICLTCTTR